MEYEVSLVSEEAKEIFGDELDEYLSTYPFPIQMYLSDSEDFDQRRV